MPSPYTRSRERVYGAALSDLDRYDLLDRNCATEVLRIIESALATGAPPGTTTAGHVDPNGPLNFIPFVAARAVGTVNLVTGLAPTAVGLALLPADAGELLRDGLNGVVYSVPELVFVSVRKGSFPIAPRGWLRAGGTRDVAPVLAARRGVRSTGVGRLRTLDIVAHGPRTVAEARDPLAAAIWRGPRASAGADTCDGH